MKKTFMKITALALAAAMMAGLVYAYDGVLRKSGTVTEESVGETADSSEEEEVSQVKDETVYVLTGADGTVNKIIVSDWIKNTIGSGSVADTTELSELKNVKGDESYTLGGDNTCVWDANGNDIYYQGTIEKELPVTLSVSYKLDGKAISPEELAGKSGKVEITYQYTNNQYETVNIDGKDEKIYVPFLMLTGMLLDNSVFTNVTVTNGKIINDGNRTIVAGLALPGLSEDLGLTDSDVEIPDSVTVTADVTDFSLGITVTLATNELFGGDAFDELSDFDISDITELLSEEGEIGQAVTSILDGASALYDGLSTLLTKADELVSGVEQLASGAEALKNGAEELSDGAEALSDGTESLVSGAKSASDGASALADGAKELADGAEALDTGLSTLAGNNDTLNAGAKKVFETLLSTAESEIKAAGITCPTLTIDNYAKTLDSIISSLDETRVYQTALETVTAAVNANKAAVETQVTAAVEAQVKEAVIKNALNTDTATYEALVAAGNISTQVQAQIDAAVSQQMASDSIKETISATTEAKLQELIDQNMASEEVKAQLTAASEGVKSLTALKASLNEYNTFYTGLKQYTAGVASAASGAEELSTGAATLYAGAVSLADGNKQLYEGAKQLASGADTLSEGAKSLAEGANTLYDGILTLKDGMPALVEGVTQLKDGAGELSDGLNEFYDTITKAIEGYEGDITALTARIKATLEVAKNYRSFSGISDAMDGEVRFIYRTDEIGASEE